MKEAKAAKESDTLTLRGDTVAPLGVGVASLRTTVTDWAKNRWSENSGGKPEIVKNQNPSFGKDVLIGWQGVKHAIAGANQAELRLIPHIAQILQNAKFISSSADKAGRKDIVAAHRLSADVLLDGEQMTVGVVVRELASGRMFYDQFIIGDAHPRAGTSEAASSGVSDGLGVQPSGGGVAIVPDSANTGNKEGAGSSARTDTAATKSTDDTTSRGTSTAPSVAQAEQSGKASLTKEEAIEAIRKKGRIEPRAISAWIDRFGIEGARTLAESDYSRATVFNIVASDIKPNKALMDAISRDETITTYYEASPESIKALDAQAFSDLLQSDKDGYKDNAHNQAYLVLRHSNKKAELGYVATLGRMNSGRLYDSQMPGGKLNKMAQPYFAAQAAQESKANQEAKPSNGAASGAVEAKTQDANQEKAAAENPYPDRPAKWRGDMVQARIVAGRLGLKIAKNASPADIVKAIDAHDAKAAGKAQEAAPAAKKELPLTVGTMPNNAEAVTVKDGVVFIGKYEALDYDSGEPITVPKGSSREAVAKALKDAGALVGKMRIFGLGEQAGDVMFSRQGDNAAQTGAQNDRQRNQSGIPAGLPDVPTGASALLAEVINKDLRSEGYTGRSTQFGEIDQKHLPHALMAGLQVFQRVTGTRVVIFRNLTPEIADFNGVNFKNGTVYINENNQYPLTLVASHEWVHNMRKTHPLLFQQLRAEVVRQGKLAEYQAQLRKDGESRWHNMDVVSEELTAAAVSDALTDPAFLQRLAERNTNTFKRMARAFLDFLHTLTGGWRDQKSNQYLRDVEAFRDKLAAVLDLYEAGDGQAGAVSKANFLRVWHGTPSRGIEKTGFKLNKIGTGEGAQAYGYGIYFAQAQDVAESYRKNVSSDAFQIGNTGETFNPDALEHLNVRAMTRRGDLDGAIKTAQEIAASDSPVADKAQRDLEKLQAVKDQGGLHERSGQLYSADIPESHELLDFDAPLSKQPKQVRAAIEKIRKATPKEMAWMWDGVDNSTSGKGLYGLLGDLAAEMNPDAEYSSTSQAGSCPISCDHIPRRSWAYFQAREVMHSVLESFKREQST
jgi:hypothetical protein